MNITTKENIREWLNRAEKQHTHMLVVCDTYDFEDYPVYVKEGDDVREVEASRNEGMLKVMEVYNLRMDIETQLEQRRSFNY